MHTILAAAWQHDGPVLLIMLFVMMLSLRAVEGLTLSSMSPPGLRRSTGEGTPSKSIPAALRRSSRSVAAKQLISCGKYHYDYNNSSTVDIYYYYCHGTVTIYLQ